MKQLHGLKVRSHIRAGDELDITIGGTGTTSGGASCRPSHWCRTDKVVVGYFLGFRILKDCTSCYYDNCETIQRTSYSCGSNYIS